MYVFYDNEDYCLYVGQNINLYGRIRDHINSKDETTSKHDLNKFFHKVEIFQIAEKDKSHLALLEQMVIALRKPLHNLIANGIALYTEVEKVQKLDSIEERSRLNWPEKQTKNLEKFYNTRKSTNWREDLINKNIP